MAATVVAFEIIIAVSQARSSPFGELEGGRGFGWMLLETGLVLLLVCALAYLVIRFLLHRLTGTSRRLRRRSGAGLELLDRLTVEPRRTLHVVRAGTRVLLLGVTDREIRLLAELDPTEWTERAAPRDSAEDADFKTRLKAALAGGDRLDTDVDGRVDMNDSEGAGCEGEQTRHTP